MGKLVCYLMARLFSSHNPLFFNMNLQGPKRKVTYVATYEALAFLFGTLGFFSFSDSSLERASALAVFGSLFAVSWNFVYNTMFERWEAKRLTRGRGFGRRVLHAVGFEIGFLVVLLPIAAWWLEISYLHSFALNLGLNIFFFGYTFAFTWCFDWVFGLPASAASLVDHPVPEPKIK
jgi:uncharacterized membrane protein